MIARGVFRGGGYDKTMIPESVVAGLCLIRILARETEEEGRQQSCGASADNTRSMDDKYCYTRYPRSNMRGKTVHQKIMVRSHLLSVRTAISRSIHSS